MMENTQQTFNPYEQNQLIVKSYFKKPIVLIIGIFTILSAIVSVVISTLTATATSNIVSVFSSISNNMNIQSNEVLSELSKQMTGVSKIFSSVPSTLITLLSAVAFILIFIQSRSSNPKSVPNAGVGILHVIAIIKFVLSIIVAVLFGLLIAFLFVAVSLATSSSNEAGAAYIFVVILSVILAGIATLLITYSVSRAHFYKSVKLSLTSINLHTKGAKAYGVFNIVFAATNGLSLLWTALAIAVFKAGTRTVSGAMTMDQANIIFDSLSDVYELSLFTTALGLVMSILTAVVVLGYKKHIESYTNGYTSNAPNTTQPYMQQPYAPQAEPVQPDLSQQPYYQPPVSPVPQTQQPQQSGQPQSPASPYSFCPNCGKKVGADDMFCNYCATKLK